MFCEGDKSNEKFYIIINGSVGIFKKSIDALKSPEIKIDLRSKTKQMSFKAVVD